MKGTNYLFVLALAMLANTTVSANVIQYSLNLSGTNEAAPNASPGIGNGLVTFDDVANTMGISITFSGLTAGVTAAHIHCCTATPGVSNAGVATQIPTFSSFPSGVTSGTYSNIFDLSLASSWNAAFITANGGTNSTATSALLAGAAGGKAYFNIHTTNFTGGEIRGFLQPVPVPATFWLFGSGLVAMIGLRHKESKKH